MFFSRVKLFLFSLCFLPIIIAGNYESKAKEKLLSMTLDQKIGQLFMVPACPLRNDYHKNDLEKLLSTCHIGGIILKSAAPQTQKEFLSTIQEKTNTFLLVGMDAEYGLGMRLKNTISFPRNLTLGAIQNNHLIYKLGKEIGKECFLVGGHIIFAPVVDINSNPKNPVIHMRSYGDNPKRVGKKAQAFISGVQKKQTLCSAKHFPGHGDVEIDSHNDLPIVYHNKGTLKKIDLYPFKKAIQSNVAAIMSAHLLVPALDSIPSSLSRNIMEEILRNEMQFSGLIISDALNMQALSKYFSVGDIALMAYKAGHEILLYGDHISDLVDKILQEDVYEAFYTLKKAFISNQLDINELDKRVYKILLIKEKIKQQQKSISSQDMIHRIHAKKAYMLKKELFEKAITVVKNKKNLIPLPEKNHDDYYLRIGQCQQDIIQTKLHSYNPNLIDLTNNPEICIDCLPSTSRIIISIFGIDYQKPNFGIAENDLLLINKLASKDNIVWVIFGTPYVLSLFNEQKNILMAYEEDEYAQKAAAKILMGKIPAEGILPIENL